MASRMFNPALFHLRTPLFAASLGVSAGLLVPQLLQSYKTRYALRLDSSPSSVSPKDWSFSQYQSDAHAPIIQPGGRLNGRAVRQMSAGSIIGRQSKVIVKSVLLTGLCRFDGRLRPICLQQAFGTAYRTAHSRCTDGRELRNSSCAVQKHAAICERH